MVKAIFTGNNLALFGAFLAVALSGCGSAKGIGIVAQAASGLISEDPGKFGKALVLEALPATQGIYGLITAFLIIFKLNILGGTPIQATFTEGAYLLVASLPIALVGLVSANHQGKVAAAGVFLIAKREEETGKAIVNAVLVETYAIFAVLVSLLLVSSITLSAAA